MDMLLLHCYMVCERIKAALAVFAMKSILYWWYYAAKWSGRFSWWKSLGFYAVKPGQIYYAYNNVLLYIVLLIKTCATHWMPPPTYTLNKYTPIYPYKLLYEAIQVISTYLISWLLNIHASHVSKNLHMNFHLIEQSKVKFILHTTKV